MCNSTFIQVGQAGQGRAGLQFVSDQLSKYKLPLAGAGVTSPGPWSALLRVLTSGPIILSHLVCTQYSAATQELLRDKYFYSTSACLAWPLTVLAWHFMYISC